LADAILEETYAPEELPALRETVEEYIREAEAIRDVIAHVTDEVRQGAQYGQYEDVYVDAIEEICREAIDEILNPERTVTPEEIRNDAVIDVQRQDALARVELAAD
jgi:hypothetical protein